MQWVLGPALISSTWLPAEKLNKLRKEKVWKKRFLGEVWDKVDWIFCHRKRCEIRPAEAARMENMKNVAKSTDWRVRPPPPPSPAERHNETWITFPMLSFLYGADDDKYQSCLLRAQHKTLIVTLMSRDRTDQPWLMRFSPLSAVL